MKQLSKAQIDALEQAAGKFKRDKYKMTFGYSIEDGWFMPQHHECADIAIRKQTCASLCGLGLFEYRPRGMRRDRRRAAWIADNEYRITTAGIELWKQLQSKS